MSSDESSRPRRRQAGSFESRIVGSTIAGKYRVLRLIGRGGMGSVFKAENLSIGRTVALKVLHPELRDDGVTLARFQREARAAASIGHPHIVEILDMGLEHRRMPFIVMEYVRGKSVAEVLRSAGPFPFVRAAGVAGQVLEALGAAHRLGIVHRDLKPDNVLLTVQYGRTDFVKLFDFGLSTFVDAAWEAGATVELTPSGRAMGTPEYASPEQIRGSGGRDPRVDLWAVGVLLFEMLAGQRPFAAPNVADLAHHILNDAPAPLAAFRKETPPGLDAVLARALAKDPAARFASARAMQLALVPFGGPAPDEGPEPTDTFTGNLRELLRRAAGGRAVEETPDVETFVRGEVVSEAVELVVDRLGEARLAALLERLGEPERTAAARPIDPGRWLPEGALAVLEHADELLECDRALLADAGRRTARRFAERAEDAESRAAPELCLQLVAEAWAGYFSDGEARVVQLGRGYGSFEVSGVRRPSVTRSVWLAGFLDEALRLSGARDADVRARAVAALGDASDLFDATWAA